MANRTSAFPFADAAQAWVGVGLGDATAAALAPKAALTTLTTLVELWTNAAAAIVQTQADGAAVQLDLLRALGQVKTPADLASWQAEAGRAALDSALGGARTVGDLARQCAYDMADAVSAGLAPAASSAPSAVSAVRMKPAEKPIAA